MKRRHQVALLIETSNAYSRELLQGIRTWLRENGGWTIHLSEQGRGNVPPPWLRNWSGQGIIARIETEAIAQAVRAIGCPVVNVSAAGLAPDYPVVVSDSVGLARLAARHLLDRGFRHFAYCGDARFAWSAKHGRNFVEHLRQAGYECDWFPSEPEDYDDWNLERRKLLKWVRNLPRPVGIMACYDIRGQQVLDACRELGLEVPDAVAVIGQHNDELLCDLCDPPLSSVIPNARRAGYEAASMLQQMMLGKKVPAGETAINPLGIATRQSTDVVAVEDRQVAMAVRHIRENACRGINVEDVLKVVPMSRTLLERRFRKFLGRAPYEEILHIRTQRACELLTATDMPISEVAEKAGFSSPEYLSASFKRLTGMSPKAYRQRHCSK